MSLFKMRKFYSFSFSLVVLLMCHLASWADNSITLVNDTKSKVYTVNPTYGSFIEAEIQVKDKDGQSTIKSKQLKPGEQEVIRVQEGKSIVDAKIKLFEWPQWHNDKNKVDDPSANYGMRRYKDLSLNEREPTMDRVKVNIEKQGCGSGEKQEACNYKITVMRKS